MACYRKGSCGPYEMLGCSECPASKPGYALRYEKAKAKNDQQDFDEAKQYVKTYIYHGKLYVEYEDGSSEPLYTDGWQRIMVDRRI